MPETKILKDVSTKSFFVTHGHEYALISLTETRLRLTIQATGTLGTYAHTWSDIGNGTFKEFLYACDYDYFFKKSCSSRGYRYSGSETAKNISGKLLRARREGSITKVEARKEWNVISDISETDSSEEFFSVTEHEKGWVAELIHDRYVECCEKDPICVAFWEKMWKPLCEEWSKT